MGTDIHGFVETRRSDSEWWDAAIRIHNIVYRQYGMFASLFGIRNGGSQVIEDGEFRAIAPARGEPPHASSYFLSDWNHFGVGETWVLWSELQQIDWQEEGEGYIDEDGYCFAEPGPGRRHERRGDYLNGGWATLFKLMETLAEQFGPENVRLSVWFDQW